MKIAFVTPTNGIIGGVEVFTRDVFKILKEREHIVDIVSLESLDRKVEFGEERALGEYFNSVNRTNNYDVVLCNGEFGYAVEHSRAINVFHGNYYGYARSVEHLVPEDLTRNRMEKVVMQRESAKGKYVVTVSEFAKIGLDASGIFVDQVIRNSVDPEFFSPQDEGVGEHVLSLARGSYYEKGFDILEELAERDLSIRLFSDRTISGSNVDCREFFDNSELAREYSKAVVLLHPSRFEGGALVTLEPLACGCPILTTPVGYGPEISREIPEFVVSDVDNIDEYLEKLGVIRSRRDELSKRGREYFLENHSPEEFRDKWVKLVEGM
mgnify:CR=1 FL=1